MRFIPGGSAGLACAVRPASLRQMPLQLVDASNNPDDPERFRSEILDAQAGEDGRYATADGDLAGERILNGNL